MTEPIGQLQAAMRRETTCRGCHRRKDQGCIVCWKCFKYDRPDQPDFVPYKYFRSSLPEPDWSDAAAAAAFYDRSIREWLQLYGIERSAAATTEATA